MSRVPAPTAIDIWPDEAIEAMHLASLALLERAGVKVESPTVRELLLAAGCTVSGADRVLVPRAVVDDAVAACPASYSLGPATRSARWSWTPSRASPMSTTWAGRGTSSTLVPAPGGVRGWPTRSAPAA